MAETKTPTAADQAVKYILDRIQTDPDLRYYMGSMTESFRLLCLAEAEFTGKRLDQVEAERKRDLQPEYRKRRPEIVELKEKLEALRG